MSHIIQGPYIYRPKDRIFYVDIFLRNRTVQCIIPVLNRILSSDDRIFLAQDCIYTTRTVYFTKTVYFTFQDHMMIPAQTGIHVIFSCGVSSYSDQAVIVSFTDFYRKLKKFYINLFENLFANLFLFENENRTRTKKFLIFANKNRTRTKNILNAANENRTRTKKISVFFHP